MVSLLMVKISTVKHHILVIHNKAMVHHRLVRHQDKHRTASINMASIRHIRDMEHRWEVRHSSKAHTVSNHTDILRRRHTTHMVHRWEVLHHHNKEVHADNNLPTTLPRVTDRQLNLAPATVQCLR